MIKKSDLKLVKHDSKVLHTPPEPFDFNGEQSGEMIANMLFDRMQELGGVGLSANQVGLNIKAFVMGTGDARMDVFNPEILELSNEGVSLDEGCLSFPGIYMKVNRPAACKVRYQDKKGETVERELNGLTCRIFLHEYDHMEGKTFKDKVSKTKWDLAYNRMIKRTKKIIRKGVQAQLRNIKEQMDKK